ncbi:hypothetical protein PPL_11018 [Heterostelium album PN500]|uniref:Uncharacterized protein n=1 Tax=Heterostelium pallidum (strain ATCC 26659 / Pp 5 / PN500) TaxID=670386 RepID=D3BSP9_HETP5|nr:hypothetical protein PPL_11018 [Heterostelium album PN500]EFA75514.1 hypothetical protein PPL_11018 [Heterostelium album PN500]|eukprot:XP_020427648.1 hypothetical protein PPL_11018 [Heterostelium album PN500]
MDGSFSVKPSHVSFEPIILGGNSTQRLYANNTYGIPVHITSIDSSDPRVTCNMLVHTIPPRSYTHIANLVFEPKEIALDDVSAVFKELPNHQQILQYTTYDEIDEYFKRDAFWAVRQQLVVPSNIIIHTNLLSDYTIKTSGVVIPPSLLSPQLTTTTSTQTSSSPLEYTNHTTIDFGSVTISSQSSKDIEIYNPLDIPVVAELLPVETESRIYQYLKQIGFKTTTFQDSSPNHQQYHQQQHGIGHVANGFLPNPFKLSREALTPIVIPPKSTAQFGPIRFQPNNNTDFSSTLLLRNNYTVFHLIRLAGRGAGGRLAIVEDNYTEYNSILLELNKTHLSPCIFKKHNQVNVNSEILIDAKNPAKHAQHSSMSSMVANNRIEVSKTFTLMNKGNMPIDIKDVYLSGDLKCSGFGFSIANCKELRGVLSPGESIQFSVSYEPDFSTSLIKRELTFRTNQDTFYFTLIGAMPHDYLPLCTHLQPSFFYEYPAKTVFIISMVILFFVLIFLTFREYKPIRGVKYSFFSNSGNANTNNSNVNSRKDHHHNNNSHSLGSHADYHMLNQHDHHNHHHYLDNLPKSPDKSNVEFANKNNSGANNTNNNKKKKNNSSNNNKLSSSHDHNQHNDKPSNVHIDSSSIHNKKSFNNDHSQSDIHVSSSKQQLKQTTTTTAAKPTTSTTTSSNPSTSSSSSSTISPSLTASQLSTIPITISQSSSMSQQNLTSSTSSSASQDDDDTTIHEEIDGSSIGSSLSSSQEIVAPLNHISNSSSGNSTLITTIVEEDTIAAEVTKIINSKQYQQQDSNAVTKATTSNLFEQSPTKKKPATKHEVVNNDKPKIEVAATSKQRPKTQKLDLTNQPQPSSPLLPTQPAASATTTIPTTPTTPTTQTDHKKKSTLTQSTQAISTITNTLTNTPSIPTSTAAAQPSTTTSTTLTTTSKDFKQREPKPRKQYETKPKPQKVYVPKVPQPQQQQQQQTQQNMLSQQQQPLTTLPTQPIHSLAASTTPSYSPLLGSSGDNFSTLFSQQQQHHQFSHNIYNPFSFGMGNDLHHHNSASSWLSPNSLSPFQSPTNTPSTSTNTSADSIPLRTSTGSNSSGQQQMKDHGVIGSGKMANKSSYSNSNITQQLPTTHSQLTYRDSSINSIASDQLMLSDSDPFSWINRSLSGESTSSQYMMQSTPNMFDQFATPSNFQSSVPSNLTYQPTYDLFNNFYFNQPPPPTSPTTQQQNNNQNNNNKQQQQ